MNAPNFPTPCECDPAPDPSDVRLDQCEDCGGTGLIPYRDIPASLSGPMETWHLDCGCALPEWVSCGVCGGWCDVTPLSTNRSAA